MKIVSLLPSATEIVAALGLLAFILVGAPFIDNIPIAALTGVMFMVVIGTFEWATFETIGKVPKSDLLVIAIVTGVTVYADLAIAVLVGVLVSALVFAWKSAQHVRLIITEDANENITGFPYGPARNVVG